MLVDMGDLPEPDTGVLSENLFSNPQPLYHPGPQMISAPSIPPLHHPAPMVLPSPPTGKIEVKTEVNPEMRQDAQRSSNTAPLIPPLLKVTQDGGQAPGSGTSYRGILNSVDASSHLYTPKMWSSVCPADMQAVMPMEPKNDNKNPESKPPVPQDTRDVFANLQGGGSLLQKISGKRPDVKDTSIVSGLPKPTTSAPNISTRPNNGLVPSKANPPYPYHPFTQEDMKVISHDAITANAKMEEEKAHSLKRKLEDVAPNSDT